MSFPNIPNITPLISVTTGQTVPLLLSSIALEELALAHIMNAEAEKLQLVLGTLPGGTPLSPAEVSVDDLLVVDASIQRTLRDVIKKEMLLQFKFENVLDLIGTLPTTAPPAAAAPAIAAPATEAPTTVSSAAAAPTTVATETFTNSTSVPISIPGGRGTSGPAAPYPSTINVAGLSGVISKVNVTLNNLTHTCLPDIEVLLVGPGGQNVMLMDDVGSCHPGVDNATYTFDDDSANQMLPGVIPASGTYRPSHDGVLEDLPLPAPQQPPAYGEVLSVFNGTNPNGTWQLYVYDDGNKDVGSIANWELTITTTSP